MKPEDYDAAVKAGRQALLDAGVRKPSPAELVIYAVDLGAHVKSLAEGRRDEITHWLVYLPGIMGRVLHLTGLARVGQVAFVHEGLWSE